LNGSMKPILIYGYGNPGRRDDGLGPAAAERIEELENPLVETDANYQLNIEDAATIAGYRLVLFVDATVEEDVENFRVRRVIPETRISFSTHHVSPGTVLHLCEQGFDGTPAVWIITVRGYDFDYVESISDEAAENLNEALEFIKLLLILFEGKSMATNEAKTVLIIDDDADIRASIRIVLEAAGFQVGEAGDGEEGLKVAEKVNPDAVIVDLMMETIDAGSKVSSELKSSGFQGPIYLLSAAGDAVRYNIDAGALGLAGIFQKPINHETLINTLKTRLGIS